MMKVVGYVYIGGGKCVYCVEIILDEGKIWKLINLEWLEDLY